MREGAYFIDMKYKARYRYGHIHQVKEQKIAHLGTTLFHIHSTSTWGWGEITYWTTGHMWFQTSLTGGTPLTMGYASVIWAVTGADGRPSKKRLRRQVKLRGLCFGPLLPTSLCVQFLEISCHRSQKKRKCSTCNPTCFCPKGAARPLT